MKVGDYVRTKKDGIGKIIKIEPFMNNIHIFLDSEKGDVIFQTKNRVCKVCNEESIIKSSPNIIDLIEEHDVIVIKERGGDLSKYEVEEYEIVDIYSMKTRMKSLGIFIDNHYKSLQEVEPIIKSIVTKEQFKNMEYKIGE